MKEPVYNLHNHTPFSDGAYTIDELCEAHLDRLGADVGGIGISDHLFCTPSSREVRSERDFEHMFGAETRQYVAQVRQAQQRWEGKLRVFCAAEINWPLNRHMLPAIRGMLRGFDYLLFECVDWAGLTQLANQARRWCCPIGLAHTNVVARFPNTSMDQVVRTLANARIFYEFSAQMLPLPESDPWFRILPNHRVQISLGTNTHDDLACLDDLTQMRDYADRRGLCDRLFVPEPAIEEKAAMTA